jgi:hypothetical protein
MWPERKPKFYEISLEIADLRFGGEVGRGARWN